MSSPVLKIEEAGSSKALVVKYHMALDPENDSLHIHNYEDMKSVVS
jgi:hypothetical protein